MPPMATGIQAAPRLPKITSSRISRTGIEKASALAMLAVTSELMATSVATLPPTVAVSPAAARLARGEPGLDRLVGLVPGGVVGRR